MVRSVQAAREIVHTHPWNKWAIKKYSISFCPLPFHLDTRVQWFFFFFSRIEVLWLSQAMNNICESCSLLLSPRGTWNKSTDTIQLCNHRCFTEKPSVQLLTIPLLEWQEHEVSVVFLFGRIMRNIYSQAGVQQVTSLCCGALTWAAFLW